MHKCASCGSQLETQYKKIDGYRLFLCTGCGLLSTSASKKQIKEYVKNKYSYQYAIDYSLALPKLYKRFARHLNLLNKYHLKGKLLDVGCGTGDFLRYIKSVPNSFSVYGIEPSEILRRAASKNTNTKIKNGRLNHIPYKNNYFDVITCYDVLEHDQELKKNVLELRRVLKPGGILLIQAPNYNSFMAQITGNKWDWWCIPDHVLHFSPLFLANYLRSNGFVVLNSHTYEDQEDFLSNIRGVYARNYLTKLLYIVFIPFLLIFERFSWIFNKGGLIILIVQKDI